MFNRTAMELYSGIDVLGKITVQFNYMWREKNCKMKMQLSKYLYKGNMLGEICVQRTCVWQNNFIMELYKGTVFGRITV